MKQTSPLIRGTMILTFAGLLSKALGFFMRIFLSRYLGAEGLGILELVTPFHVLGVIISSYGVQTVISRFVSASSGAVSREGHKILKAGLFLALVLAIPYTLLLCAFSVPIASCLLQEAECASLLSVVAICTPLEAIHLCINGYYYGRKKTGIPALSQLVEQTFRILSMWFFFLLAAKEGRAFTPFHAVLGSLVGDVASILFNLTALSLEKPVPASAVSASSVSFEPLLVRMGKTAFPLTLSQTITHVFHSVETVLIPTMLRTFGYDNSTALSMYGILTGMALPLILFPSTLTNSFSVLLLPTISEAESRGNHRLIDVLTRHTIHVCLLLGIFSTGFFQALGKESAQVIFDNSLAGSYIITLGFLCPFLFLNMTLSSVLNGLGRTALVFRNNLIGLSIRILFSVLVIPRIGIYGYFTGFLLSSVLTSVLLGASLRSRVVPLFQPMEYLWKPILSVSLSSLALSVLSASLPFPDGFFGLGIKGTLLLLLYLLFLKLLIRDFSLRKLVSPFRP